MSAKSLGLFIRWKREEERIEQKELARRAGIDPSQISRIESGKQKEPNIRVLAEAINLKRPGILMDLLADAISIEEAKRIAEFGERPLNEKDEVLVSLPIEFSRNEVEQVEQYIAFIQFQKQLAKEPPSDSLEEIREKVWRLWEILPTSKELEGKIERTNLKKVTPEYHK